jgi:hypothetical protein
VGWLGRRLWSPIIDDAVEYTTCLSSSAQSPRRRRRKSVLLEGTLEQLQTCVIRVHLGLDLLELRPLCRSNIIFKPWVVLPRRWFLAWLGYQQGSSRWCYENRHSGWATGYRGGRRGIVPGVIV